MSWPEVYTKNYVNSDDIIATSNAGAAQDPYLYDDDPDTQWESDGVAPADDSYGIYIQVDFEVGGESIDRTIDRVFIGNHNLKKFKVQYWDGAAWQDWQAYTVNSTTDLMITVASQTISKIKIIIDDTIAGGTKALVGAFWAMNSDFTISNVQIDHPRRDNIIQGSTIQPNGSALLWRVKDSHKYGLNASIREIGTTLYGNLETLWKTRNTFGFAPDLTLWPGLVRNVVWTDQFSPFYDYKPLKIIFCQI